MKKFLKLFLIVFCLFLFGCEKQKESHYVIFTNEDGDTLYQFDVTEGDSLSMDLLQKEGYYYEYDFDLSILNDIQENLVLTVSEKQVTKDVKYYVDGELVYKTQLPYKSTPMTPYIDEDLYDTFEWVETITKEEKVYYYVYNLQYELKSKFNITYYDGDEQLNLAPAIYDNKEVTTLPTITKEGYEFVGWYLSDLSLCSYEKIEKGSTGDYTFYARFIETTSHERLTLPEASLHFTKATYNTNVWQPVIPSTARSTNPGDYDWSSSDTRVFDISSFSSIRIVSSSCAILTATLKADSTYTINCIIKTTINGVSVVSEEEANTIELVTVTFKGKDGETIATQKVHKNGFAYLPTPPTYEGYYFNGWDKDNYNLTSDTTITATYSTSIVNEYAGKSISIIGDSVAAYESYIPAGYATFFPYPISGNVNDVNMMWYMMVANKLGMKCFINDSYAGSCVQGGSEPTSGDKRLSHLVIDGHYADYTLIFMGNNDCAANKTYPLSYNASSFETYYKTMIEKIQALCPNTTILLCTLPNSKLYVNETRIEYNNVIKSLASTYNCKVIDLEEVDLTSKTGLLVDNAHPTFAGMNIIYDQIIKELLK